MSDETPLEEPSLDPQMPEMVTIWVPIPKEIRGILPVIYQTLKNSQGVPANFPKNEREFAGSLLTGALLAMHQQIQAAQRRIILPPGMEEAALNLQKLKT